MNRMILVLAVAALASVGCSNKKLIAQKDAEIADLQGDVARLQDEVDQQKRMRASSRICRTRSAYSWSRRTT